MISIPALCALVEKATNCLHGHCTEKILQTIISAEMNRIGINCQTEVVLPVMREDTFVGHNRLDIVAVKRKAGGEREVLVVELKTIRDMKTLENIPIRVRAQCSGYLACTSEYFGRDTKVNVVLVNVHMDAAGGRTVRVFDMLKTMPDVAPVPIRRGGAVLYEVDKILDSRGRGARQLVLVQWKGYNEVSWEPLRNMPALVRREVRKRI